MRAAERVGTTVPGLHAILPIPRTRLLAARLFVNLLVSAMFVVGVVTAVNNWHLTDLKAYLAAAELLASGGNPFEVQLWERGLPYHYHYSPWFAALFVPLISLPAEVVQVGWSAVLVVASALALVPLIRAYGARAFPLVMLMAFLLTNIVAEGNVQPILLAGLVWTLERRAGPVAVGVAASLKITPILLALVYAGRGQWGRAILAGVVAAVLVAPTFLFELPETATATGGTGLFTAAPVLWAATALGAVGATWWLARGPFGWLAAATATVLALPRLLIFDVTNLLVAIPSPRKDVRTDDRDDGTTGRARRGC
jgi:hypothetical protein